MAVLALIAALLVGSLTGILRTTPNKGFVPLDNAWTELFRNLPLLVQIFLWHHVLPSLLTPLRGAPSFVLASSLQAFSRSGTRALVSQGRHPGPALEVHAGYAAGTGKNSTGR